MLKKFLLVVCLIVLFILPKGVNAQTATVTDKSGVYLRKGPGTNYEKIKLLKYATTITIVDTTKHEGKGCDGWYQVNYNGSTNSYICSELVKVNTNTKVEKYYTSSLWGYRVNENYATVRKTASTSAQVLDRIWLGTPVIIIGEAKASSGCSSGWYKISYYNETKEGYVCKRLIDTYEDITAVDEEYAKTLKDLGFPNSYIPFLTKLHQTHPNWIFEPIITNKDFDTSVDKESGKNYIQTTVGAYIASNEIKEGSSWYEASSPIVAYYLDPRNYLNEKNIFAFERLNYNEKTHTKEVLKSVFSNTYLEADEYLNYFLEAGKKYDASPIHLASRVKQEGGTDEDYDSVSGKSTLTYNGKSLVGFYNYYNIGAYEDAITSSAVARGLATAAGYIGKQDGTPWDTREKAIIYGASFIANGYINAGQYTMYFQKFNTSPTATASSYTHQYMTNIIAPASEALSMYNAYLDIEMLDTNFTFSIPVYNNMPDEFTIHPLAGDSNNDLTNIKVNNIAINGFDKDITSYTHYIPANTNEIDITVDKASTKSMVSNIGKIKIDKDETQINIVVTSQVGTKKTYELTLIKVAVEEIEKTIDEVLDLVDIKLNDTYMTGIEVNTTATILANNINKHEVKAIIKILDKDKSEKTDNLKTGDKISISLNNETKEYTIVLKGDNDGDGKISIKDLLRVQKHILGSSKLTNEFANASDNDYDGKITIKDLLRVQKHILGAIKLK